MVIYDIAITKGDKILYYEKWIPNFGFINMSKKDYERKFVIKGEEVYIKK